MNPSFLSLFYFYHISFHSLFSGLCNFFFCLPADPLPTLLCSHFTTYALYFPFIYLFFPALPLHYSFCCFLSFSSKFYFFSLLSFPFLPICSIILLLSLPFFLFSLHSSVLTPPHPLPTHQRSFSPLLLCPPILSCPFFMIRRLIC